MDAKRIFLVLLIFVTPFSVGLAQDKATPSPQASKNDIEALKAQLKEHEERINKLSQEVSKLNEALGKQKPGSAAVKTETQKPEAPKAEPVASPAASPGTADTAGVEIPTPTDTKTHVVAKGETLSAIAKAYGVSVQDIEQLNKIEDAKKLQAGQTIKIPPSGTATPTPSPSATP
jgi:LysM repeat protein